MFSQAISKILPGREQVCEPPKLCDVISVIVERNRLLRMGQKEWHQHMSQHVLLMPISTLTAYACFEKDSYFNDIL